MSSSLADPPQPPSAEMVPSPSPFPPRSDSPPLPPRKNVAGLPPSYLRHLRRLLHQWLEQQTRMDDHRGLPPQQQMNTSEADERLWSGERLQALEKAIWEGAVVPQLTRTRASGKKGRQLLELDWADWIRGALNRKAAWQKDYIEKRDRERLNDTLRHQSVESTAKEPKVGKQSRKSSVNGDDPFGRGRLTVPGSPLPPTVSISAKFSPRPPSIASSSKISLTPEPHTPLPTRKNFEQEQSSNDAEEELREWCRVVSSLKGFQRFSLPKKDDWEVVEDDFPKHGPTQRDLPGAFPQSSSHDYHESSDERDRVYLTASSSKTRFSDLGLPTPVSLSAPEVMHSSIDLEMLKPVFCLHFPSSEDTGSRPSVSTLRLKRNNSLGARSNASVDSNITSGKKWWNGGSGGKWSEMTLGPNHAPVSDPEVEFVEGQFALPSSTDGKGSWRTGMHKKTAKKRKSVFESFDHSPASTKSLAESSMSIASDTEVDDSLDPGSDEANSSTWSGTQKGSEDVVRGSWKAIIAGSEDDIPRQAVEDGQVGIVGGTIVVKGVDREEERKALQSILQLLIYTIQTMAMELDLLDAFRVPRESDEPLLPPKHARGTFSVPQSPVKARGSLDILRKNSLKEKGERHKGFFHRLGKESKTVWEGLLGKRRSSDSHERDHKTSLPTTDNDLPATPVTGSFPASQQHDNATPPLSKVSAGLSNTSMIPHPTERHLQILSRLETQVHSTTPGLLLPMPPLLLRLREEQALRQERAKEELQDEPSQGFEGLPGQVAAIGLLNTAHPAHHHQVPNPVRGRALGYRLGGDVRTGLGALSSGLDTFGGWMRLQRIDTLYCVSYETNDEDGAKDIQICQRPKQSSFVFWDAERDRPIHQIMTEINDACQEETMICSRSGCTASQVEHTRSWVHAGKTASVKVDRLTGETEKEGKEERDRLDAWVKCEECGKTSEARNLNSGASQYSWGKFLELLYYTDNFRPKDLCSHLKSPVSHCFREADFVLSLTVKPVSVLDTRLPKLQVGPNVSKRKTGKDPVSTAMDGLVRKEVRDERTQILKKEIMDYYDSLTQRLNFLARDDLAGSDKEDQIISKADVDSLKSLLSEFDSEKSTLLELLQTTPTGQLNDLRLRFTEQIRSSTAKLVAWQKKHASQTDLEAIIVSTPEYASNDLVFALPGSAVLIREDEPASVIAYTLSSLAYFTELTNTPKSAPIIATGDEGTTSKTDLPSGTTQTSTTWTVDVKRRDTPRDPLSLRTIAKKKSEIAVGQAYKPPMSISLSANAPSLELSLEQVEGKTQGGDRLGDLVKTINKATAQDPVLSAGAVSSAKRSPSFSESEANGMPWVMRSPPRGMRRLLSDPESSAPPSAFRPSPARSVSNTSIAPSTPTASRLAVGSSSGAGGPGSTPKEGWGSVTSSFSNSFNQLLKIGSEVGESIGSIRVRGTDRSLSSLISPLGMMTSMDNSLSSFDDRPHIQFTYTLGDRLKVGCTVYYATAFDSLRRRCAIDKSIITSLSRTNVWDAQGGKSKAAFFMTHDKRYIVKELVSKWNVSDTHALLEIAPSYFEHLAGTHNKATSLAKIVGFYTVRINDLQTGTKRQMDLLVMENLFYKQSIARTYDLKGIEGRKASKVKAEGELKVDVKSEGTLFDGEWLEGMQKGLVLLQPHAKRILLEAISLDTRFLSSQSIMDYSLLLGVDEGKHEIVVGLVDAIGSYNLFKTIESRGKMVMNRGGEVTIIPPDQYRERFTNALKHYFIACPDKWSKTSRRGWLSRNAVPSVL